jgi:glycosyltransferase involved in cell wall biosynthesis
LRILVVTSQFPLAGEPTRGRPILQTVRELAQLAEVRVLSPVAVYPRWARPRSYLFRLPQGLSLDCDAEYVGYPALPAISRPFNGWLCGRAIEDAVGRFRPDVLLSYWLYPDAYGAMLAAKRHRVPLVAGARGSDIRVRDPVSRRLTRPIIAAATRLLVVSADLGRLAEHEYGADPARVRVVANGCDATIFQRRSREAARNALGVPCHKKLIVYAGRLVAEKGLHELLAAVRELSARQPEIEMAMLGDGPLRDGIAVAANRMTGLRVHLPGALPPETVARWMQAADVVTLPSYSEGHPNVLVEALACGRPVVATPVGGVREIVDDSCGILVPPRDATALAAGLARALAGQWDEEALSRRFSRSWRDVADDTLGACIEALEDSPTAKKP